MLQGTRRVLIVANRTATTELLLSTVRRRAQRGDVEFHLLVPATPRGLHRLVDPEVAGREEASAQLERALEALEEIVGAPVSGHVGAADPMCAIADTLYERAVDEIIISTLPHHLSRWMRLDLPSKVRGLGLPVTHVEGTQAPAELVAESLA